MLPLAFPAIVLVCLGLGAIPGLVRPQRFGAQPDARFAMANSGRVAPDGEHATEPEFVVNGDPDAWSGPWAVRHRNPFGRDLTSDPKPSLQAAFAHARILRDARGANVLEIVEARDPLSNPAA